MFAVKKPIEMEVREVFIFFVMIRSKPSLRLTTPNAPSMGIRAQES